MNRGWRFCRPLPYHLAMAPSNAHGFYRPGPVYVKPAESLNVGIGLIRRGRQNHSSPGEGPGAFVSSVAGTGITDAGHTVSTVDAVLTGDTVLTGATAAVNVSLVLILDQVPARRDDRDTFEGTKSHASKSAANCRTSCGRDARGELYEAVGGRNRAFITGITEARGSLGYTATGTTTTDVTAVSHLTELGLAVGVFVARLIISKVCRTDGVRVCRRQWVAVGIRVTRRIKFQMGDRIKACRRTRRINLIGIAVTVD